MFPKRTSSLKTKIETEKDGRVVFPTTFNPHLPNIKEILKKHFTYMTNRNEDLKESFPLPPMIAFRQPPNLKQLICKSKLHDVQNKTKRGTRSDGIGWKKCGNGYPICPFTMNKRTELTGKASKFNHKITQNLNCDTEI